MTNATKQVERRTQRPTTGSLSQRQPSPEPRVKDHNGLEDCDHNGDNLPGRSRGQPPASPQEKTPGRQLLENLHILRWFSLLGGHGGTRKDLKRGPQDQ